MVYYPISVLMLAGIKDILMITTPADHEVYKRLLGDGSQFGIRLSYVVQANPNGMAQAFIAGVNFIGDRNVALILGDNLFYGQSFSQILKQAVSQLAGATVFGYRVSDPERFGVVEFNSLGEVLSIEEKPHSPKSDFAVTGLYFYDNDVVDIAKSIVPSSRGELEITDVNEIYRSKGLLNVEILGRGFAWLDSGTFDSLLAASTFVQTVEQRQGLKVACLEEIGYSNGWLTAEQVITIAKGLKNSAYGDYLIQVVEDKTP